MNPSRPVWLIVIGFVCVLLGAGIPFLMVMQYVKSTFFLNFFSYTISVIGLFLGITGAALFVRYRRKRDNDEYPPPRMPQDHDRDRDW